MCIRKRSVMLSVFLVFLLVSSIFVGFFFNLVDYSDVWKNFVGVKQDSFDDVGINFPDGDPYNVIPNTFGSNKIINWDYFKQHLNNIFDWSLYYKKNENSNWKNGNQYLDISKEWKEEGYYKITLGFDAVVDVYQAEFVLNGYIDCLDYVDNENDLIKFKIPANETEFYNVYFNYSDLKELGGLYFFKDLNSTNFRFGFGRYNIPSGYWEFDPQFGDLSGNNAYGVTQDIQGGRWAEVVDGDGTADYILVDFDPSGDIDVKCALYDYTDYSPNFGGALVGETEEKNFGNEPRADYRFNFSGTVCVTNSTKYYIMVFYNYKSSSCNQFRTSGDSGKGIYDFQSYGEWEDPLTGESATSNPWNIMCSYTVGSCGVSPYENTHPTVSCVSPVNSSTGNDLQFDLSFCCNDSNSNESKVVISESFDGVSYTEVNISTGVLNQTIVRKMENFSGWATLYYAKVYIKDSYGSDSEYWYSWTTKNYNGSENVSWTKSYMKNESPLNQSWITNEINLSFEVWDNQSNISNVNIRWSFDGSSWEDIRYHNDLLNESCWTLFNNFTGYYATKIWFLVNVAEHDEGAGKYYRLWYMTTNYTDVHGANWSGYNDTYPTIVLDTPTNNSVDVSINTDIVFTISDDNSTGSWYFNMSYLVNGSHIFNSSGTGIGQKTIDIPNLNYSQNIIIWVNYTDDNDTQISYVFNFTTIAESDIELSIEYVYLILWFICICCIVFGQDHKLVVLGMIMISALALVMFNAYSIYQFNTFVLFSFGMFSIGLYRIFDFKLKK